MTTPKTIDRKSFLTSAVAACAAVTLGACSSDGEGGGTDATGGAGTGGTGTGGTGGVGTGGTSGTAGTAGTSGAGSGGMAATGGGGTAGNATGGAGMSGMSGGGAGGAGGSAGGGGTLMCMAETNNGMHAHPLTIPPADVERGYQDAPYVLEDGGTGHTHTLEMSSYEYTYLQFGDPVTVVSSMDAGHTHDCVITCAEE